MRRISLTARQAQDGLAPDAAEVVLLCFEHETLEAPLRISTNPTERISTNPLSYGTRSRWLGADPVTEPYLFVAASAAVPGDMEEAGSARLVLAALDTRIAALLRGFTDRAVVHVAVVLASSPDEVEAEWRNRRLMSAQGSAEAIALEISRVPIEDETVPTDRFTRSRFPGLWR